MQHILGHYSKNVILFANIYSLEFFVLDNLFAPFGRNSCKVIFLKYVHNFQNILQRGKVNVSTEFYFRL